MPRGVLLRRRRVGERIVSVGIPWDMGCGKLVHTILFVRQIYYRAWK
jgi:hypothetical protein